MERKTFLRKMAQWGLNVAIGLNQLCNAVLLGDPQEMMSSRLGKMKRKYGGRIPWWRPLSKLVDWGLERIDAGHTIDAINEAEGEDAIFDREGNDGRSR